VRVLTDAHLREHLVQGGRATLARYSEERIIGEIEALYMKQRKT